MLSCSSSSFINSASPSSLGRKTRGGPDGVCSDMGLAIGLIALGASLVADDQCEILIENDKLHVSKPKSLPECIEMRGIGLVSVPTVLRTQLKWVVDMDRVAEERMPEFKFTDIRGHRVPTIFAKNMDDLAFRIYVVACNELSEF